MSSKYKLFFLVLTAVIFTTGTVVLAKGWFNKSIITEEQPDPNAEWQKLINRYQQLHVSTGLNMEGEIRLFDGNEPEKIKEQNTTVFRNQGQQYFYSMAGVRYLCDGEILLQVDPINQIVILSKAPETPKFSQQILPQLNQQTNKPNETFLISGIVEGDSKKRKLTINSEMAPEIKSYTITYDPATYNISNIEIEWWKNNFTETKSQQNNTWITRIQYQYHPPASMNMEAEMKKSIAVIDGKITLIGAEKDYKLEVIN